MENTITSTKSDKKQCASCDKIIVKKDIVNSCCTDCFEPCYCGACNYCLELSDIDED